MRQKRLASLGVPSILTAVLALLILTTGAFAEPGNVDGRNGVDLRDAVMALQVCAGMNPQGIDDTGELKTDDNNQIGLEEAIYALQVAAGMNPQETIWYKDKDGDGYSDGTTLISENRPADYYKASELIATSGDTDDDDPMITGNGSNLQMTYSVPPIQVMPIKLGENDVQRINLGSMPLAGKPGEPVLPVIPTRIMLPDGFVMDDVQVTRGEAINLTGSYEIEYGQMPYPLLPGVKPEFTEKDPAIYGSDAPYPGKLYDIVGVQKLRGVSILLLNLHPVEYRPLSGKVTYYRNMSVKVIPSKNRKRNRAENYVRYRKPTERKAKRIADNPEMLTTYKERDTIRLRRDGNKFCDPADSFKYVLITSEAIKNAVTSPNVDDLIEHRKSQGVSAIVVTIEDVYANYTGVDPAEQLRNFIRDAYNNWETDFVLLGGDINIIPMRKLWCRSWEGGYVADIPSDLYYQCLDGSFNFDGDDKWGEPTDGENGGEVDLYAELYVGRASAENAEEMANFIYKTLVYEKDNSPYKKRALMVGEHLGFGGVSEYGKNSMEEIRTGTSNHGCTTAGFESDATFSVDVLYQKDANWDKSDIINQINSNQFSVINHLGHANYDYVKKMHNGDTDTINNSLPAFAYSQGCIPGNFEEDCIAERLTTSTRYGMFAVVYNSRYGWGTFNSTDGPSQRYNREFWDAYFSEGYFYLGAMNADSHEDNTWRINNGCMRWCFYESNLLGDPATTFVVTVDQKILPVANAGKDQNVDIGDLVTLDASASSDDDGNIVSYFWEQTEGPAVLIDNADSVHATFTAPDPGFNSRFLTFRLTVTDNDDLKDSDVCKISINRICSYKISPAGQSFDVSGGTGSVSVSTTNDCEWTAVSNTSWITVTSGSSGTGSGTVSYSVEANPATDSRSGTITIAGKTFTVTQFENFAVIFPDPVLESEIRKAINKPSGDILRTDLEPLTSFTYWTDNYPDDPKVKNIEGMQYCTNLTSLNFNNNRISDISALARLKNLTEISFGQNNISDINALAGLTNLTSLEIYGYGNHISDISALAGLKNLTNINFSQNLNISDINALAGLTHLEDLNLSYNQISDISALAGLINLKRLSLYGKGNRISDISAVAGLKNLTSLSFGNNQISDISPVAGLINLTYLDLGGNPFSDINALAGLKNLTHLRLDCCEQISDISPVAELKNLPHLSLYNTQLSDISAVTGLTNLTDLNLAWNQISDISAVAGLKNLTRLDLADNQISDISAVAGLTNLKYLSFWRNQISDISAVAGLKNLTGLEFGFNQISDINAVAGLTNLTDLHFWNNQVSDISVIAGLTNLENINLSNNQISDIKPLIDNSGIGSGDIVSFCISGYTGSADNPLSTTSLTVYIPQLENRGVDVKHTCP